MRTNIDANKSAETSRPGTLSSFLKSLLLITVLGLAPSANAAVKLFACEPEWRALAIEIGGDKVEVMLATTAAQDPHHVEARPSLIAKLRRADMLLCTGAGLEVGWLPLLQRRAGNSAVRSGQPGHLLAANHVPLLEVPSRLDRSEGDQHPEGNPHVQLDPHNLRRIAQVLTERLVLIDGSNADYYQQRLASFEQRWSAAIEGWQQRALPLRGKHVVVHHRNWSYLLDWLGMVSVGELEPAPGLPTTVGHLSQLAKLLQQKQPFAVIRSTIDDPAPSRWLAERSGAPQRVLPQTVGAVFSAVDLESLFDYLVDELLATPQ